jgi:quinol monooxygenase YgiN
MRAPSSAVGASERGTTVRRVSNPNPLLTGTAAQMLVVTRHQVADVGRATFLDDARQALAVLSEQPGFLTAAIGQSTDDANLFVIESRWVDVGAYRRALSAFDVKMRAVPLLSTALDEPSAFEVVVARTPGDETTDRSGLADDAGSASLGSAAAPSVESATP